MELTHTTTEKNCNEAYNENWKTGVLGVTIFSFHFIHSFVGDFEAFFLYITLITLHYIMS
jgi:hypothetical protein